MFLYPFLQGQRRLQGPIWSSEREAVPADAKHGPVRIKGDNLKDECVRKRKTNKREEGEREDGSRPSASTDGRLLSSNYTDEGGAFFSSHLRRPSERRRGRSARVFFTSLIDERAGLNKQRHAATRVSCLMDKSLQADVLLHTDNRKRTFTRISSLRRNLFA